MCDPLTLGVGLASSTAGGIINRNSQLANAEAQARARNAVLASKIGNLNGIYDKSAPIFADAVSSYAPDAANVNLKSSQDARVNAMTGNMTNPVSDAPVNSSAAKGAIAAKLKDAFNYATTNATNLGRLGGYKDAWFNNDLKTQQASRDIGVNNNYAAGQKALIAPEQDAAAAAAYQPPSIWGSVLSGAGSIMGSYAGAGGRSLGNSSIGNPTRMGALY